MSSKKTGPCPRCGASHTAYVFVKRWKYCSHCHYDRYYEGKVAYVRGLKKRGLPVSDKLQKVVDEYQSSLFILER